MIPLHSIDSFSSIENIYEITQNKSEMDKLVETFSSKVENDENDLDFDELCDLLICFKELFKAKQDVIEYVFKYYVETLRNVQLEINDFTIEQRFKFYHCLEFLSSNFDFFEEFEKNNLSHDYIVYMSQVYSLALMLMNLSDFLIKIYTDEFLEYYCGYIFDLYSHFFTYTDSNCIMGNNGVFIKTIIEKNSKNKGLNMRLYYILMIYAIQKEEPRMLHDIFVENLNFLSNNYDEDIQFIKEDLHVDAVIDSEKVSAYINKYLTILINVISELENGIIVYIASVFTIEEKRLKLLMFDTFLSYLCYNFPPQVISAFNCMLNHFFKEFIKIVDENYDYPSVVFPIVRVLIGLSHTKKIDSLKQLRFFECFKYSIISQDSLKFIYFQQNVKSRRRKDDDPFEIYNNFCKYSKLFPEATVIAVQIFISQYLKNNDISEFSFLLNSNVTSYLKVNLFKCIHIFSSLKELYTYLKENSNIYDYIMNINCDSAQYCDRKSILLAYYILDHPSDKNDVLYEFPVGSSKKSLVYSWLYIIENNFSLGEELVGILASKFTDQSVKKLGVFSSENFSSTHGNSDNNDDFVEFSNYVTFQNAVISLFKNLINMGIYSHRIVTILCDYEFNSSVVALPVVTNLTQLLIDVKFKKQYERFKIVMSLERMIFKILSYMSSNDFYKNIRREAAKPIFNILTRLESVKFTMNGLETILFFCLCQFPIVIYTYLDATENITQISDSLVSFSNFKAQTLEFLRYVNDYYPFSVPAVIELLNLNTNQLTQVMKSIRFDMSIEGLSKYLHLRDVTETGGRSDYDISIRDDNFLLFLKEEFLRKRELKEFITNALIRAPNEYICLYIPQILQCLKNDNEKIIEDFLKEHLYHKLKSNQYIIHRLLWTANEQIAANESLKDYCSILNSVKTTIEGQLTDEERKIMECEFGFIKEINELSDELISIKDIDSRKSLFSERLKKITNMDNLYLPTFPDLKIERIIYEKSKVLKSSEKAPVLISFQCRDIHNNLVNKGCIFKVRDDLSMDCLILQLIETINRIFSNIGLDVSLKGYQAFVTGRMSGIIEVIENSKTIHEIKPGNLLSHYIQNFGSIGSDSFKVAQQNFVKSLAPYSLVTYLFHIKDRHNANIMIDKEGHVIHIDFGFIFGRSPGNVSFEKSPFKFIEDYMILMGPEGYQEFIRLFSSCFIAVRSRYLELESIMQLMTTPDQINNFRSRLFLGEVSNINGKVRDLVEATTRVFSVVTTSIYDMYQSYYNGIN